MVIAVLVIPLSLGLAWLTVIGSAFDPGGVHEAGALPGQMQVCGRTWSKGAGAPASSESIASRGRSAPEVVAPGLLNGLLSTCPHGACSDDPFNAPCDTVIYVRVGTDSYIDYALSGGP